LFPREEYSAIVCKFLLIPKTVSLNHHAEYDISAALTLAQNISYGNAKKMISKEK